MKNKIKIKIFLVIVIVLLICSVEGVLLYIKNKENPKDVMILFTSDVHCGINENFGYAGLYEIKEKLKTEGYETLLVDNGDSIQGDMIGSLSKGEDIIDLMNELDYDIAIPGNHDFDYGVENFLELSNKANFQYISCNFNKDGNLIFKPYVIKEIGKTKIAFIGVTTPETITSSTPGYFKNANGEFIYGFFQDGTGKQLYNEVQKSINSAKNEGAEYIIVLGHLGDDYSAKPYTYADVISNTSGINVLLDGHSHDTEKVVMKDKDGNNVLRIACGTKMANIGWLKISNNNSIDGGLYTWNEESSNMNKENKIQELVNKKMEKTKQKLSEKIGNSNVELTINDPTEVDSTGNSIRIVRRMETNLGDLCADAFKYEGKADVAIINGGGIRANLKKGDITLGDIYKTFPFENRLCVMEVTGQQILDALEWGAKSIPAEDGSFLQVSGITYEIHTNINSSCTCDENKIFKSVEGEYRVKNVMIGNEPLDLNKTYKLASISYVLKLDGDGQSAFKNCKILNDEIELDSQVLINYIKEKLDGKIENIYEDAYGEERIIIKK